MDKRILLIIGGGIAAYKSLFLIRLLAKRSIAVRVILTKGGAEFVTPLSAGSLSGERVFTDLWDLTAESEMGHIELSRSADLVVVAPATADLMAKAAQGIANDLASTTLLATDKRVLYVPAMNVRMWDAPATQRNIKTLKADGQYILGPDKGAMACGEYGPGRMSEPEGIADAIESLLSGNQLISGPVNLVPPLGVETVKVETARDMLSACEAALPADVFVSVAAVADWRPADAGNKKIKKSKDGIPPMNLVENPDILKTLSNAANRPKLVVGFAAETNDVTSHAQAKLTRKGCDWIIANDVSGDVMGGDHNAMILVKPSGVETWARQTKDEAAKALAVEISKALS